MSDLIYLLNKKVGLYQPDGGYKTNQDAVLLAAACPAKGTETVLDMGCGVGGALFCLLYREPDLKISGIDFEKFYLSLAKKNAIQNNAQAHFIHSDLVHYCINDPNLRVEHILMNPPYFEDTKHTRSNTSDKANARMYNSANNDLESWIKSAFNNLKNFGSLTIIYPADHLDKILISLGKKFGSTEIIPIMTRKNEPAKRVIIRTIKDRKSPCTLHHGVVLHNKDLSFSKEADQLLRDGLSFDKIMELEKTES